MQPSAECTNVQFLWNIYFCCSEFILSGKEWTSKSHPKLVLIQCQIAEILFEQNIEKVLLSPITEGFCRVFVSKRSGTRKFFFLVSSCWAKTDWSLCFDLSGADNVNRECLQYMWEHGWAWQNRWEEHSENVNKTTSPYSVCSALPGSFQNSVRKVQWNFFDNSSPGAHFALFPSTLLSGLTPIVQPRIPSIPNETVQKLQLLCFWGGSIWYLFSGILRK